MGYYQKQLDEQLAQVAAGQRSSVDADTRANAVAEQAQFERAMTANGDRLAAISEQQSRDQAEAAREAASLSREAMRDQREHQRRMEALEAERDEAQREHMDRLEFLEEERNELYFAAKEIELAQLAEEARANEHHRARLIEFEEDRNAREHAAEYENRLRTSPSYMAAVKLNEQRILERPFKEQMELEQLLVPASGLLAECRQAVAAAEQEHALAEQAFLAAEATRRTTEERQFAERVARTQAELQQRRERLLKEAAAAELQCDTAKASLEDVRRTLNPLTWAGEKAKQRSWLAEALNEAQESLRNVQEQLAATRLESETPLEMEDFAPGDFPSSSRKERIEYAAMEFLPQLSKIESSIEQWFAQSRRSDALCALLCQEETNPADGDIDYKTCILLDSLKTGSISTVEYPGLGVLPSDLELASVVARIAELKARAAPFDSLQSSTEGWRAFQSLKLLTNGFDIGNAEDNQLMTAAEQYIQGRSHVSQYDLSSTLGISVEQGAILAKLLEASCLIGDADDFKTHEVFPSGGFFADDTEPWPDFELEAG